MAPVAGRRRAAIHAYRIPLDPAPRLAGGPLRERRGLVLRLEEGGRNGFGEAAPLPGFSVEDLAGCEGALTALAAAWVAGVDRPAAPAVSSPSARYAFDCARLELAEGPLAGATGLAPWPLLNGAPAALLARWRAWPGPRPAGVKLKVGALAPDDAAALLRGLLAITPALRLRLDANRGWDGGALEAFADALAAAERRAIDYVEEPCPTPALSLALAARLGLPLALDESLREPGFALPDEAALAALVLKPAIGGGLAWLQGWLAEGRRRGLRCVLSSSFESSLGLGQLAALAVRLTPGEPPGLDTLGGFGHDLLRPAGGGERPLLHLEDLPCRWQG